MKSIKKNSFNVIINIFLILIIVVIIVFIAVILFNKNIEKFENKVYNQGINNADKILYINLQDRKDRNEYIMNQLLRYGATNDKIHRINAHYTPGNGHLGCAKSHRDAIQYAIDNNLENVIVFEDDFTFSTSMEETNDLFNKFFKQVDKNEWDVVLFAHSNGKVVDTKYPFIEKITNAQDGSGYIVNKKYFEILRNTFNKSVTNMKQEKTNNINFEPYALDQVWKENQMKDQWMVFNPILGKQNKKLESTIETITNYTDKK
jgi:GR25 family glycosyltransferase involved in LPS biosynthesis